MTQIEHTEEPLPEDEYFCVSLKVKKRYINPIVKSNDSVVRLYNLSTKARRIIDDFLLYSDTAYGCVKLI